MNSPLETYSLALSFNYNVLISTMNLLEYTDYTLPLISRVSSSDVLPLNLSDRQSTVFFRKLYNFFCLLLVEKFSEPMLDNLTVSAQFFSSTQSFRYKRIKDYVYDMESVLGQGSFSTVYRAVREATNQPRAVKVVKLNSLTFKKLEELLQQEISVICSLEHPNIIRCFEVLKSCNHCYFIMDICEQGSLESFLKRKGTPLKQEEIWPYIRDIFEGLKYLASKNIIHRDIKTANIFLKEGVPKIADFGFAVQKKQPFYDLNIGSPLYMSPEGYLNNRYGPKTDVWAFGVVIYELLHGRVPLLNCTSEEALKHSLIKNIKDSEIRSDISQQLRQLIRRCLDVNENQRISVEQIQHSSYIEKNNAIRSKNFIRQIRVHPSKRISLCYAQSLTNLQINVHAPQYNQPMPMTPKTERIQNKQNKQKYNFQFKPTQKKYTQVSNKLEVPTHRFSELADLSNGSILIECDDTQLILGKISFNQAIGFIHYCRVGFKLTQERIDKHLSGLIGRMEVKILEELLVKVNLGLIVYDEQENKLQKNCKLQKVVKEYLLKYKKWYKNESTLPNISKLLQLITPQFEDSEKKMKEDINRAYLFMLFSAFTQYLQWCISHKDYTVFGENGIIDSCLQSQSIPVSSSHYFAIKDKYNSLHPCNRTKPK